MSVLPSVPVDELCVCVCAGEKLDYKACESLEEVLKRVQFKVVDLEQTSLDEDVGTLSLSGFLYLCISLSPHFLSLYLLRMCNVSQGCVMTGCKPH